jgi:hypothetical protein
MEEYRRDHNDDAIARGADYVVGLYRQLMARVAVIGVEERLPSLLTSGSSTEHAEYVQSLGNESDRAVPILYFSFIDTRLEGLIRHDMSGDVQGGIDELFGGLGMLATASARINFCHAVRWISPLSAGDLHRVRKIRNHFAHERRPSFEDQVVQSHLSDMEIRPIWRALHQEQGGLKIDDLGGETFSFSFQGESLSARVSPRFDFIMSAASALMVTELDFLMHPYRHPSYGSETHRWLEDLDNAPSGVKPLLEGNREVVHAALKQEIAHTEPH